MKKFLVFLSAALITLCSAAAAQTDSLSIKVDGRAVNFREGQPPIILNDRTYVPVRRVLNAMGASVDWDDSTKTVTVTSDDNITRLILTIDDPEITVYTFTSVLHADETKITSDAAPVIVNDRTMLPIRVIAEALGATVKWDDDSRYTVITSKRAKKYARSKGAENTNDLDFSICDFLKPELPVLSLSCDAEDIKEGDSVKVKIKLDGIEKISENAKLSSTTVSVYYDPENFKYKGFKCIVDGEERDPQLSANNGTFYANCAKVITLDLAANAYLPSEDGTVLEVEFTALNSNGGKFSLSDGICELGKDCELIVTDENDDYVTVSSYQDLYIDTTEAEVK